MTILRVLATASILVSAAIGRPQLHLTPQELKAFRAVLGKSKPVSITSAIPVMAFSDNTPSRYVDLPVGKLGLLPLGRGAEEISSATLVNVASENTRPSNFHEYFGRGTAHGPIISSDVHQTFQPSTGANKFEVEIHSKGNQLVPPSKLTFGFKPIYDSPFEDVKFESGFNQGIGSTGSIGSFQPSSQFPSVQYGNDNLGAINFDSASFKTDSNSLGQLTNDNLDIDLSALGKPSETSIFDITSAELKGVGGSVSQVDSGENLYRHHVPSSLVPTSNAGPGTTAVGKLLANRQQGNEISGVFTRSIDSSNKEKNKVDVANKDSSQVTSNLKESIESSLNDLANLKLVSKNGAIVLQRTEGSGDSQPKIPGFSNSQSSVFVSSSVKLPNLPNVQLPLQDATESEQRSLPDLADFQSGTLPRKPRKLSVNSPQELPLDTVFVRLGKNQTPESFNIFNENPRTPSTSTKQHNNAGSSQLQNSNQQKTVIFRQEPIELQSGLFTETLPIQFSNQKFTPPSLAIKPQVVKPAVNPKKPPLVPQRNIESIIKTASNTQDKQNKPVIQRVSLTPEQLKLLQQRVQQQRVQQLSQPNVGQQISSLLSKQRTQAQASQTKSTGNNNSGTTIVSAGQFGSLPPSALQALGGFGGLAALGGGGGGGGQPQIIVKTLELDAKDADPTSDAFKKALERATKEAKAELGVSESEELGVFGKKRRRKRQLLGGGDQSNAASLGTGLSTATGLYVKRVVDSGEEIEDDM